MKRQEQDYLNQRRDKEIEKISVYDVPRAFIPSHILEMAELALRGDVRDYEAFAGEANEWWQIYGRIITLSQAHRQAQVQGSTAPIAK